MWNSRNTFQLYIDAIFTDGNENETVMDNVSHRTPGCQSFSCSNNENASLLIFPVDKMLMNASKINCCVNCLYIFLPYISFLLNVPVYVILAMVGQFWQPSLRDKESLTIRSQTANSSGHAINKTAFVG